MGGTVVAAGLATALVLTDVIGLAGWRGGAESAAAARLDAAASAAIRTSDPVVGPGQYLEVSTRAVFLADVSDASTGGASAYLATQDGALYLPHDLGGDWVWDRPASTVVRAFGMSEADARDLLAQTNGAELLRAKAGGFYNEPAIVDPTALAQLPRDPRMLLNRIYRITLGQGSSPDGEAVTWIADQLRSGLVPADLRAAMYRALAMIPGVTITDPAATLDGRTGVAFGRDASAWIRQEVIVDPATGLLIGERLVRTRASGAVPAGTVQGSTAVTTAVVDAAPAGGTVCGNTGSPVAGGGCE